MIINRLLLCILLSLGKLVTYCYAQDDDIDSDDSNIDIEAFEGEVDDIDNTTNCNENPVDNEDNEQSNISELLPCALDYVYQKLGKNIEAIHDIISFLKEVSQKEEQVKTLVNNSLSSNRYLFDYRYDKIDFDTLSAIGDDMDGVRILGVKLRQSNDEHPLLFLSLKENIYRYISNSYNKSDKIINEIDYVNDIYPICLVANVIKSNDFKRKFDSIVNAKVKKNERMNINVITIVVMRYTHTISFSAIKKIFEDYKVIPKNIDELNPHYTTLLDKFRTSYVNDEEFQSSMDIIDQEIHKDSRIIWEFLSLLNKPTDNYETMDNILLKKAQLMQGG